MKEKNQLGVLPNEVEQNETSPNMYYGKKVYILNPELAMKIEISKLELFYQCIDINEEDTHH